MDEFSRWKRRIIKKSCQKKIKFQNQTAELDELSKRKSCEFIPFCCLKPWFDFFFTLFFLKIDAFIEKTRPFFNLNEHPEFFRHFYKSSSFFHVWSRKKLHRQFFSTSRKKTWTNPFEKSKKTMCAVSTSWVFSIDRRFHRENSKKLS